MEKKQIYYLNRQSMALQILADANRWIGSIDNEVPEINEEEALQIVDSIIQEVVDSKMEWLRPNSCHLDGPIARIIETRLQGPHVRAKFYSEVVDEVWRRVFEQVDHFIPQRTWKIWHLRTLQNSTIVEEGVDYRIADWERRMESGEWQRE